MKRSSAILGSLSIAALLFTNAAAMNGKHIAMVGSKMQFSTIQSDAVSATQNISTFDVASPRFNINGTQVACWKKDGTTWYLSTMDVASKAFTDLLNASTTWSTSGAGGAIMWPAGDWIYFERPSLSGEIWRVSSTDPTKRDLVIDFTKSTDPTPLKIYNFKLTPDLRLALTELNGASIWTPNKPAGGGIFVHRFPPTSDAPGSVDNLLIDLPNCNPCLSPTGMFCGRFYDGGHLDLTIYQWNESSQSYGIVNVGSGNGGSISSFNDIEPWSGQADWANVLEGPDWAVNSDRWMTISISTPDNAAANSVVYSWMDHKTIKMTNNSSTHTAGGCLYVEGTADNVQNINGTWSAVAPVSLLPRIDVAGSKSPYQVTLSARPAGADLYYTTNGADPTQSSSRYTGPFDLHASTAARTVLKVRAFLSGQGSSNVVQKVLYFDMTRSVGLTCELWKNVPGSAVSDLTSDPRYPNTPDRTWLALSMGVQYGDWYTQDGKWDPVVSWGYRIRGYIVPSMSGSYQFSTVGVTASSVRLSTGSTASSAVEIVADTHQWWNGSMPVNAVSAPISLVAGNWYYIEAIHKHAANESAQFFVSWKLSGSQVEAPRMVLMPMDSTPPNTVQTIRPNGAMARQVMPLMQPHSGALYNVLGNRITATVGSQARLPAGIYFVKMDGGRRNVTGRMVVRAAGGTSAAFR